MAGEEERDARKPRDRYRAAKTSNADRLPQRNGTLVEFSMGRSDYIVDVAAMYQKNLDTGHRRAVQQRGSTWYFNASSSLSGKTGGGHAAQSQGCKMARYDSGLQRLLEDAHRESQAAAGSAGDGQPDGMEAVAAESQSAAAWALVAPEGSLTEGEARASLEAVLAPGVPRGAVQATLEALVMHHGIRCSGDDARRVVLCVRSLAALQLVLRSNPDVLVGLDVFERRFDPRFARLKINSDDLKRCLKAVLARGARLGHPGCLPSSKLLRKIDADAFPEWVRRYVSSMARAGLALPEHLQARIEAFL